MVSEIKKEKRLWFEEYFMEEVEHVLGQEAFNEVGGNGGFSDGRAVWTKP